MLMNLNNLRDAVKGYMSEERFLHTLGVEEMATILGEHFLPNKLDKLRCAALLHDIAKELPCSEQTMLADNYGIHLTEEDLSTIPALHSFAAVPLISRDFSEYTDSEILSAVFNHTLGDKEMSLFDKIIYLSDYIEFGREYESSKKIREFLFGKLSSIQDFTKKERVLNQAIVMSIDFTIEHLTSRGKHVHSRTLDTKNALSTLI